MAKLLRFVAVFFVLAPITAMFSEPFFEAVFDHLGWDTESWAGPFVQIVLEASAYIDHPNVLLLTYIMGAVGAGVWMHWLAVRVDSKRPSKADTFASLSYMISNVRNEIFDGTKDSWGQNPFSTKNRKVDLRLKALYSELRSLGFQPPNYDSYSGKTFYIGHYSYLQTLEPFAERGNIKEAKRQGKATTAEFKAAVLKSQQHPEPGT